MVKTTTMANNVVESLSSLRSSWTSDVHGREAGCIVQSCVGAGLAISDATAAKRATVTRTAHGNHDSQNNYNPIFDANAQDLGLDVELGAVVTLSETAATRLDYVHRINKDEASFRLKFRNRQCRFADGIRELFSFHHERKMRIAFAGDGLCNVLG